MLKNASLLPAPVYALSLLFLSQSHPQKEFSISKSYARSFSSEGLFSSFRIHHYPSPPRTLTKGRFCHIFKLQYQELPKPIRRYGAGIAPVEEQKAEFVEIGKDYCRPRWECSTLCHNADWAEEQHGRRAEEEAFY